MGSETANKVKSGATLAMVLSLSFLKLTPIVRDIAHQNRLKSVLLSPESQLRPQKPNLSTLMESETANKMKSSATLAMVLNLSFLKLTPIVRDIAHDKQTEVRST